MGVLLSVFWYPVFMYSFCLWIRLVFWTKYLPRYKTRKSNEQSFPTFWLNKKIVSLWFKITFTGCQFWIPLGLISFIYAKLCFRIWNNQVPGNPHNDRDYHLWFQKKKSVKMMISVVAVFSLCWLPWHTFYIIKLIWPSIAEWVEFATPS